MKRSLLALLFVLVPLAAQAQGVRYLDPIFTRTTSKTYTYSEVKGPAGVPLRMKCYEPEGDTETRRAKIDIFHGGSCETGSYTDPAMLAVAQAFAERGFVACSVEYRLDDPNKKQGCNDGQSDGHAGIRYSRAHMDEFKIDPRLYYTFGFSTGARQEWGLNTNYELVGTSLDTNRSNPGFDSRAYGGVSVGIGTAQAQKWPTPGDPPHLFLAGRLDPLLVWTEKTHAAAVAAGLTVGLHIYPNAPHNLFTAGLRADVVDRSAQFLYDHAIPKPSPPPICECGTNPDGTCKPCPGPVPDRICSTVVMFEKGEGEGYTPSLSVDGLTLTFTPASGGIVRRWRIRAPDGRAWLTTWDEATRNWSTELSDCTPGPTPTPTPSPEPTPTPTPPSPGGPVIKDLKVARFDDRWGIVEWSTVDAAGQPVKATNQVICGALARSLRWDARLVTFHRVSLFALQPGQTYVCDAVSEDAGGKTARASFTLNTRPQRAVWDPTVPKPWGIEEQAPAPTKHVRNKPGCDDAGPGTEQTPWCSLPATLPAGTVVGWHSGVYDYGGRRPKLEASGTATRPVFITGIADPGESLPVIRNTSPHFLFRGEYLVVENVLFDKAPVRVGFETNVGVRAFNVVLRYVEIRDGAWNGWDGWGRSITVYAAHIHHHNRMGEQMGLFVGRDARDVTIADVETHFNSADGVHANGAGWCGIPPNQTPCPLPPIGINVVGVRSSMHRENGFDFKWATKVLLRRVEGWGQQVLVADQEWCYPDQSGCLTIKPSNLSSGDSVVIGSDGPTEDAIVSEANLHNNGNGIRIEECRGKVQILGSTFTGNGWGNIATQSPVCAVDIDGNTILGGRHGIVGPAPAVVWRVTRNTIAPRIAPSPPAAYIVNLNQPAPGSTFSDNHIWYGGQPVRIRWGGADAFYVDTADMTAKFKGGAGNLIAQPLFVSGGFRPAPGSPVIEKGVLAEAYAAFAAAFGYSIQFDHVGTPIPEGSAPDIGAYEVRP